jgi:hypothetical protein
MIYVPKARMICVERESSKQNADDALAQADCMERSVRLGTLRMLLLTPERFL